MAQYPIQVELVYDAKLDTTTLTLLNSGLYGSASIILPIEKEVRFSWLHLGNPKSERRP
jgi:hypothetical protein